MRNILIVDDSSTVLGALDEVIKNSEVLKPYYARCYKEAQEFVKSEKFFAAIVDLELPDCESGKAVDLTLQSGIPTIVLTGAMNDTLRNEIVQKNIVDYIFKSSIEDVDSAVLRIEDLILFESERVLLVDDSKASRAVLRHFFRTLLFDVIEADGGDVALELLKNDQNFKIVAIDYEMPSMNGVELLQKIKKLKFKKLPLFFGITGNTTESVRFSFLKYGASDVFYKPIIKEEFTSKISNAMRLLSQQEEMERYISTIDRHVITSATDLKGNIVYVSEAFCEISGYTKDELMGKNHNIVRHPDMPSSLYAELWKTISGGEAWKGEIKNRKKDGTSYWVFAAIEPVLDKHGVKIGYRAIRQDVSDKKLVEQLAITDRLTQIYNRVYLDQTLQKEIAKSKRSGSPLSIILLDIDKFKGVNDTFGHQAGDSVLKESAQVLKAAIRSGDTLGRWGGEEFLIIAPDTDTEGAKVLAEKLRAAMEAHDFAIVGKKTGSFGVSTLRADDTEESLLKRADDALYRAKEGGRNRVEVG